MFNEEEYLWNDTGEAVQAHWRAVAAYAISILNPDYLNAQKGDSTPWLYAFSEREQNEINFAKLYARDFKHGTDGHNAKVIIAAMAHLLDVNEAKALPYDANS